MCFEKLHVGLNIEGETGAHWDMGYCGTVNILEILRKKIFTAVNLVRKSYFFDLCCNFVSFFCNFYRA